MFNNKNKQIVSLQQENNKLKAENNSFLRYKISEASDYDLKVLYKYFEYTSEISLAIQKEYYWRAELHKEGIDVIEERNDFGTLYQNQELILKLYRENERLRRDVRNYKGEAS